MGKESDSVLEEGSAITTAVKRRCFDPTKPLWLPEGSVRAILILMLSGTLAGIMIKFAAAHEEIPSSVEKIMMALLPALVLLIDKYISTRATEKANGGKINGGQDG
jgi:hypothetical protein